MKSKFKLGDKVKIIVGGIDKEKFLNHIGTINDIGYGRFSIIITDDKSLNIVYHYNGEPITDSGKWWYENEIILYNVNKRIS